jgi:hypothetical protein
VLKSLLDVDLSNRLLSVRSRAFYPYEGRLRFFLLFYQQKVSLDLGTDNPNKGRRNKAKNVPRSAMTAHR